MRKVFLSLIPVYEIKQAKYVSADYELGKKDFLFPLTYLIESRVQEGDSVEIISAIAGDKSEFSASEQNYNCYKSEVQSVLEGRGVSVHFSEINCTRDFDALTFNRFFKEAAFLIKDNDIISADITFGLKPYMLTLFIALAYVAKAAQNIEVENIIYAKMYDGSKRPNDSMVSEICDLSALFHLNSMAGNAVAGQKQDLDQLLNFIITD